MSLYTTRGIRLTAIVASTGLVVASSGFGAVYAYTVGISHGYVLAGLTVLFAVALELAKPLAIHSALTAWGNWRTWGKALALSILGLVAVAYSLTAELSLTASSRGDLVAKREQSSDVSQGARERHQRAKRELDTLKSARPVGELEPLVAAATPVCRVHVTNVSRQTVCSKPPALVAELGRAKRKAELEGMLERSEDTLSATPAVKSSDPGSYALATYLAAVGVVVAVDILSQFLTLIPVLALEVGSALAMVLVAAVSPPREPPIITIEPPSVNHVVPPASRLLTDRNAATREAVAKLIENHLRDHGGSIRGSERSLAKAVGTSKPTARRAMQYLADRGRLVLASSKQGTMLTLV